MPIKKKKQNSRFPKVLMWILIITLIALMIISFSTTSHMTEIVVYP